VETAPVGQFPANAFGLHDMHGNLWEWVQDVWHDNYAGAPGDGSAWLTGGDQSNRVLRGGSWFDAPQYLRSAYRYRNWPDNRIDVTGFRIARTF
jgi:formylglycine-generating enzyme required for sulfatase activity